MNCNNIFNRKYKAIKYRSFVANFEFKILQIMQIMRYDSQHLGLSYWSIMDVKQYNN